MKKLILTCAYLALAGCSDDKETTTGTGTDTGTGTSNSACDSSLTFEKDIQTIVSDNCASCHSSYGALSGITSDKSSILSRVKSTESAKVMPKNNLAFKTSANGTKLISWLSCDTLK